MSAEQRVLVTGGSGLLGWFVVDELLDRTTVSVLDLAPPAPEHAGRVAFHRVDVLDLAAVHAAVAGHDAVVHLAGIDDGNPFPDEDYFRTNVVGAWNVLHAAQAAGVGHAVVASSSAVYGIGRTAAPDRLPVDEDHPRRPLDTYGHTKVLIEETARHFARRGAMRVTCLRPTLIVRPAREAAILAQLALDDPHSEPPPGAAPGGVTPYGALSPLRSYVRSRDAARCFRLALEREGGDYEVFNVAAADGIGHPETLPHLRRFYGEAPPLHDPQRYRADPCAAVLDATRARERLGWTARGDWSDVGG